MSVFDLYQSLICDPLKILLRFLVHKVTSGDCPSFDSPGKRHRAGSWQFAVVCRTEGEVAHELQVANTIRSHLEVAYWDTIDRLAFERLVPDGLNAQWETR